VLHMVGSALT